ncbi:MAG TPA: serine hydrolase [Actinospica sp.]|jgi:hypothetical protein|nr:serine hydrolase [Actinospica sp.]HWG24270.1 serine hydrolase [Actinospica sp.]
MGTREDTIAEIEAAADAAGVTVWPHARPVDGGPELGIGADRSVVTASVVKVPMAVEPARQAAAGGIDHRGGDHPPTEPDLAGRGRAVGSLRRCPAPAGPPGVAASAAGRIRPR